MTSQQQDTGLAGLPRFVAVVWPLGEDEADLAGDLNERLVGRLASSWGRGEAFYRSAPFLSEAHPSAGWQDARSPRDLVSALLSAVDDQANLLAARPFRHLDDQAADVVLRSVLDAEPANRDAAEGFNLLRQLIYDALFVEGWEHPALGWHWLDGGARPQARG